ncbi:hypothetical protein, partial [uncultured Nostoc sp.]|uniref:hypothetical protein n=1 Tax=uncultured Nostoc sp. TaxID=340711 RepID=UPI0035CBC142
MAYSLLAFVIMKKRYSLLWGCLLTSTALAQTNYVANSANSATPGTYNTLLGPLAGYSTTSASNNNVLVGYSAGYYNTGTENSFIGYYAGYKTTTGNSNSFLGYVAGF